MTIYFVLSILAFLAICDSIVCLRAVNILYLHPVIYRVKRMKSIFNINRLYPVLAMAAALCSSTSCFKVVEVPLNAIKFETVVHKSTKAPIMTNTYANTDPEFGVFAFFSDTDVAEQTYFQNLLCTNNAQTHSQSGYPDGVWYTTPASYWPASGALTFVGYSPYMESGVSCDAPGMFLSFTAYSVAPQDDLLYSLPADASRLVKDETTIDGIPIQFRHALSMIQVSVKTDAPGSHIALTGLKLGGFHLKGNGTVSATGARWSNLTGDFSMSFYPATVGDQYLVTTEPQAVGSNVLVLPETLTEKGQCLLVSYSIAAVDTNGNPISEGGGSVVDYPVYLKKSDLAELQSGKLYRLVLNIGAIPMLFSADAIDWEEGNNAEFIL